MCCPSFYNTARDEQKFNEMWAAVVQEAGIIGVEEPVFPRRIRQPPRQLDEGHNHTWMKAVKIFTEEFFFQWSMLL